MRADARRLSAAGGREGIHLPLAAGEIEPGDADERPTAYAMEPR
jgi:hypothetical protein